jgi:3-oxoacyl-[acyl-carrier-protein] synthase-1
MSTARRLKSLPITALALVNGLGTNTGSVLAALRAGRSGLGPCPLDLPFETTCGALPAQLDAPPDSLAPFDSRLCRVALLGLEGVLGAVRDATRRLGRDRVGIVAATSTGGILESEHAYASYLRAGHLPPGFHLDRQHAFHGLLAVLRAVTGAAGPAYIVSTACSSSGKVFGSAQRLLEAGLADAVLIGGVDTLCQITLRGFGSLQVLSREPCRPFSAARDGTSIGEGAAFLLLEREGDGLVRLLGVGESCDAHHMSHPHPEGLGARLAMEAALDQAGLSAAAVDHVNAHGTGTPANDVAEARAIAAVLGREVPVASTKGYTGHLLGAAGATEAVLAALCIMHGFVPESLGANPVDPAVGLAVCRAASARALGAVLSNSFAFGGSNVSVLLGAAS